METHFLLAGVSALALSATAVAAQDVAVVELSFGSMDLSADSNNDGDFDDSSVFMLTGQAFARTGNYVLEIQGQTTGSVDDTDDAENSSSFGAVVHYIRPLGAGNLGFAGGVLGGTNVEENDGAIYGLLAVNYGGDNWSVGLGNISVIQGQDDDDQVKTMTYVSGAYSFDVAQNTSLQFGGYYGQGISSQYSAEDVDMLGAELNATIYYDVADNMTAHFGISSFRLEDENDEQANGTDISFGLSIVIGGSRDRIPFDTPDFHREMTWADEAF